MNGFSFFKDRVEAGRKLAGFFDHINGKNAVVYALPRGGVVVGTEIAKAIGAPLDLIITRKIGHPFNPEYAIGAITENGHSVFNKEEVLGVDEQSKIIIAVPVTPKDTADELRKMRAEVLAIISDKDFLGAIGAYYRDFTPVEDQDVIRIMKEAAGYGYIPVSPV